MDTLLLKEHMEAYPRMDVQDAVKLAYQSAFGCGHLLPAQETCAGMIAKEMEAVGEDEAVPAWTPIGNGLCRLNLASAPVCALGAEMIARMMVITDETVRARGDNQARFEAILTQLHALAKGGETPFAEEQLQAYLTEYRAQGCPVVSHTPAYRAAYRPAYRVVLSDLAQLIPVLLEEPSLIVIDGPCGSGKSTLAGLMARLFGTETVPMDDFFLPFDMRTPERLAQPGGNVHYERFDEEVLSNLERGKPVRWNRFNCSDGTLIPREIPVSDVVVIEGSYSHHPFFRKKLIQQNALLVYVSVKEDEQRRRIAERDPELLHMFETRWIPLEKNYFEAYDIQGAADVVIESEPW
ncbi:MAG: hypothetical protein IKK75_07255 [Clostridia bacterium]|nr:hypothetical protein [Clostridia bacterium]